MEESISGFKVRGTWGDVVEHGERITRALHDVYEFKGVPNYPDAFVEWDEWRPKSHERIEQDINEKTADQASVKEGKGEQAGKDPNEDICAAGEKLSESYKKLDDDDTGGAVERWGESIEYVSRAADPAGRKALRSVENTIYQRVMTQIAPYYFDNDLISANLQRSRRNGEETFVFEVNVNDDELKEQVSSRLAEYEDEIDRWHVDTEKDTEVAASAEGVEPPKPETDSRLKPSKN